MTSGTSSVLLGDFTRDIKDKFRFYNGRMDEVRIYNRAFCEDEIKLLANPEVNIDIKPCSDPNAINPGS